MRVTVCSHLSINVAFSTNHLGIPNSLSVTENRYVHLSC